MGLISSILSEGLFKPLPWSMWSWSVGKRVEQIPGLIGVSS
jgi:hypothetical protein